MTYNDALFLTKAAATAMPRDIDPHEEQQTPPKADRGGGGFVDTVPLPIPQEYPVSLRQRLRAVACFLAVVVSGYFGTLFLLGPLLPLAYLAPSSFLFFVDCSIQLWNMLTEVCFRVNALLTSTRFVIMPPPIS